MQLTTGEIDFLKNSISILQSAKTAIVQDGYYDGYVNSWQILDLSVIVPTINLWIASLTFNKPYNKYFDVKLGTAISIIKTNNLFLQSFRQSVVEDLIPIWRKYAGYETFIELLDY